MIYQTKVNSVGKNVGAFGGKMLILFGKDAPNTLKDFCYTIDVNPTEKKIEPGQKICFGNECFEIERVGNMAEQNLNTVGHLTVLFNAEPSEMLPGSMIVKGGKVPPIEAGTVITIEE